MTLVPMRLLYVLALVLVAAGWADPDRANSPYTLSSSDLPAPSVPADTQTYSLDLPPQYSAAVEAGTRTLDGSPGPAYWQQEVRYELQTRLWPDERRLQGQGRIVYTNRSPDTLSTLHLELTQNLHAPGVVRHEPVEITGGVTLDRVAVDGQVLEPTDEGAPGYTVEGTQLILEPSTALPPGGTAEIEIAWSFAIPQAGAGARMGYSEDNLLYLAYWYPAMAVYDDVYGWHTDPFTSRAEFYHEFGDYDVTIEAPAGWLIMGTGSLQNPEEVLTPEVVERMRRAYDSDEPVVVATPEDSVTQHGEDGLLRWRFTASNVRDFAFSATRSATWEAARTPVGDRDGDGQTDYTHINTIYRPTAPLWQDVTRYQQHAITFHSSFTGFPYPWPHMTAVEGGGIITGGMEFPMMTLMGDYNARGDSALYYVTAHELAHMWVPMIVGVNERRFSWVDEGMTSFLENQARKDFYPGIDHDLSDQEDYIEAALSRVEGEMMRWSDFHYSPEAFVVASYRKPATVLVALQDVLGDETFMNAYRTFIEEWAYKHPYPFDFFNTVERVSGRELDWFWQSWFYETWMLDQAIARVIPGDEQTEIVVENEGRVPMPVHLAVTLENGETVTVEVPVDTWLRGAEETTVTVETPVPVSRVEIDPERSFPDVDRSDNVWTR